MTNPTNLIAVGASAGGLQPLLKMVTNLPSDLNAAVCVVVHTAPQAKSILPLLLSRSGPLKAEFALDGEPLLDGRIYVAPPDHHILIRERNIYLNHGPVENMFRPAIDPLFRTAASAMDRSVIGVILSGSLDDGTAGLSAIKARGGIAIVQEPTETAFSGMPESAISRVDVDYVLPIEQIGLKLNELCADGHVREAAKAVSEDISDEFTKARLTSYICPECGGPLSESSRIDPPVFACRVGHKMSTETFLGAQSVTIERALWTAVRALEERADLANKLATRFKAKGRFSSIVKRYEEQAQVAQHESEVLLNLLMKTHDPNASTVD